MARQVGDFLDRLLKSTSFSASNNCFTMLESCMTYIALQEIDHTHYGSFFPNTSLARFYLETCEKLFYSAWMHWIDFTLNRRRFDDGLEGFKTFELQEWKDG